ncbi:MAG: protein-arginine deiminase family protein [Tepidisphaeraceae bacterium]
MPQLYHSGSIWGDFGDYPEAEINKQILSERGVSLFANSINSFVNGTQVVTGETFGPRVRRSGTTAASDILRDYVTATFKRGGFTVVSYVDSRLYTLGSGGVHCGTNAVREIPDRAWWL